MADAPKRIYLQHDVEDEGHPFPKDWQGDEVTWCVDRIAESDIAYVRADLVAALTADAERFVWWFSDTPKSAVFMNEFMRGVREHWSVDQWRIAIDTARSVERPIDEIRD